MLHLYRNPRLFFTGFILLVSALYWIFPDIMPFHQGFGFEGYTIYKPLAEDVRQHLFTVRMNSYSIQRIFPFVLLHAFFKVTGISFTDAHMLLFFQIFQLGLALLIIGIWDRLARFLQLGLAGQWVGYLSMLVNFATLKHDFYIPFTYDRLALTSGLLSLYFYSTNRTFALFLNALIGLTVWPTALIFNLIMLLVPVTEVVPSTPNPWLSRAWAAAMVGAVCGLFVLVIYVKNIPELQRLAPAVRPLIPISILLVAGYLGYTQGSLAQRLFPGWHELVPRIIQLLRPRIGWLYALTVMVTYFLLTRVLGDPSHPYLTPQQFAINYTYGALQRPAQSIICHALYYGLPVLLLALFWQRALRAVTHLGLGVGLMFMAVLIQAVNNETRQLANALPLLALLAALVANDIKPRPLVMAFTAVITLITSKSWLPLNYFDPYYGRPNDIYPMLNFENQAFLQWPQQAYFMNFGPWTATPYLILQSVVIILVSAILYWLWTQNTEYQTTPFASHN